MKSVIQLAVMEVMVLHPLFQEHLQIMQGAVVAHLTELALIVLVV
jgi:hypothetical protein